MSGPATYFHKTYDETMALLIETRNYVAFQEMVDQRTLSLPVRLQLSYESLRVTCRLTQAMAWLLAQKAYFAGELTVEQLADEEYALSGGATCTDPSGPDAEAFPVGLRSLLDRSLHLYQRIERLDRQVRRNGNRLRVTAG